MILAVEDVLSEVISRRLLSTFRPDLVPAAVVGFKGNAYLQSKVRDLNRTAASIPVLVLTDLDNNYPCATALIDDWLGQLPRRLILRVAVQEVESWLMADRERFCSLIGIPRHRLPEDVDSITDPKLTIVNLARRSRQRGIIHDFVPSGGSTASVGPGFSSRLIAFASTEWRPVHAAAHSQSLRRAIQKIQGM